ncbi:MAG: hypothetical protein Q8R76_06935 [Candidatus Omnitrophota bacterium]|nr:hypothetical protein [Candidatus Omnitrophota bacterium]
MKKLHFLWLLPVVMMVVTGCGKQADPNKPIDQIKQEVEGMSVSQLQSQAQAYAKEIQKKGSDMSQVQEKLKSLSPKDLLGEKAKGIKDEVSKIGSEVKALTQRYNIYADQFKQAGGDISKIQIA